MNRRFVNLLVDKFSAPRPAFKLHRIDPATLFYPTGSPKPPDPVAGPAPGRLPPAAMSFDRPCEWHHTGWIDFMAFKKSIVVAVDNKGRTLLYDSVARAVRTVNPMQPPLDSPRVFVGMGARLYVMEIEDDLPSRLRCDYMFSDYDSDGDYKDAKDHSEHKETPSPHPCAICAFTVVRDSQIWVSMVAAGTYSFDTVSSEWSKVGAWVLPFRGRTVYVPEYKLWIGFSDEDNRLCAPDLTLTVPVPHKLWEDPTLSDGCSVTASHLLPLGTGRLCVARLLQEETKTGSFTVLSGVEVFRVGGSGSIQMIKHKSRCYSFRERDDVKLII
ncbi:uncharacterized protein [Aegilops tauschii subsp. strangulata]|uniref:uncharacterized protein n=1 Tax=Aegilops tauschii subsp. strangulata TaxID=200361 RepID=UPI001E216B5C